MPENAAYQLDYDSVMRRPFQWAVLSALMLVAATTGCDTDQSIAARLATAETNVVQSVPVAREFCKVFPRNQITLATIVSTRPHKRDVQIASFVYERYLLYLNCVVEFRSAKDFTVVSFGDAKFRIVEVTSVFTAENGNPAIEFGQEVLLTTNDVNRLSANGFDFSRVGIPLKTNAPVSRFQEYAKELLRRDW